MEKKYSATYKIYAVLKKKLNKKYKASYKDVKFLKININIHKHKSFFDTFLENLSLQKKI